MRRESLQLTLSVSRYQGAPYQSPNTKDFLQAGGTIGRLPKNDLVLEDPRRIISGCHARIRYEDDAYFLDDVSTNGVFMNDAADSIGKGNSVRLTHGDTLRIGDYVLRVDITTAVDPDSDPFLPPAAPAPDPLDLFAPSPPSMPAGASDDPFAPKEPVIPTGTGFGIPDDLDPLDLLNDPPPASRPPPSAGSRSDHIPAENFHFETPRAVGQAIPDDWDKSRHWTTPPPVPIPPPIRTDPPPVVAPPAREIPPSAARPEPPLPGIEGALPAARAFCSAAGLPPDKLGERPVDDLMRDAGVLLRAAVGGLIELLAERSAFKGEFRLDQTMIRPMENNPLKFSGSPEDALKHLLLAPGQAFLEGEEAVGQGIQDLKDHRVAMLAAMRTAFEALVRHFDPDNLEASLDSTRKKPTMMRLVAKNRAWEMYRQYYAELKQDPDRLFRDVIGEVFARAYEAQVALLAKERG